MPCHSGWQYAVEHIDPARHAVENVFGMAYPHQITRFVSGQEGRGKGDDGILHFRWLANTYAADGYSIEGKRRDVFGRFASKIFVNAPLHDSEYGLGFSPRGKVPGRPAVGPLHRGSGLLPCAWKRRTFVEAHADIDT